MVSPPITFTATDEGSIDSLWSPLQKPVNHALTWCHTYGINVHLICGRLTYDEVKHDAAASCPNLHGFGLGLDFGIYPTNASVRSQSTLSELQLVGEVFESLGFTWGGRWPGVLHAGHVHWDRGIGNRPRTFDRVYRDGGLDYLYSRLLLPTGQEHAEQECQVWFDRQSVPGILIQGELHVPLQKIPVKISRIDGVELDGEPYLSIPSSGLVAKYDYWPSVTIEH